ncbi:hypothetical protein G9A89_003347 [Geosiphon pyriformis]|nr:hypothetical protein G9A89_003347 [Geosiphon pyriformis]
MGVCFSCSKYPTLKKSKSRSPFKKSSSKSLQISNPSFSQFATTKYNLPTFDSLTSPQSLAPFLYRYIWQSNFSSPILHNLKTPGFRVLDIGYGSSTFLQALANEYPLTIFTGIDLKEEFVLDQGRGNLRFHKVDLKEGFKLDYEDESFDFVCLRFLGWKISENEIKRVLDEGFRCLKSGGWVEVMDLEGQGMNQGFSTGRLTNAFRQHLIATSKTPHLPSLLTPLLNSHNLLDIQINEQCHPLGDWDDLLGEVAISHLIQQFFDLKEEMKTILGVDDEGFEDLIRNVRSECSVFQTYWISVRGFGVKPYVERKGVIHEIAASEQVALALGSKNLKNKKETGNFNNKPKLGRPHTLSDHYERNSVRLIIFEKCSTAVEAQYQLQTDVGIQENELCPKIKREKPWLTYVQKTPTHLGKYFYAILHQLQITADRIGGLRKIECR